MAKRIIFRVEGNDVVGHGHFMRCLAMARHLKEEFECNFAMSDPSGIVLGELLKWGFTLIRTPSRAQYHPDDIRSNESWHDDVSKWLAFGDLLLLDGYRFDVSFVQAAHKVNARVVQVVDDFVALDDVDAVITALPIEHEFAVQHGLPAVIWTGIDGFLLRPEFFEPEKDDVEFVWDWFLYVTNEAAMKSYRGLAELRDSRVLALATPEWLELCEEYGWEVLDNPPIIELIHGMRSCKGAKLPASTIAIEYLVATGRSPEVSAFALNQQQALVHFTEKGLWKKEASVEMTSDSHAFMTAPQRKFITWMHGRF